MFETIGIILVALWILGLVSSTTLGGYVHLLLIFAIVAFLARMVTGRRPL